MDDLDRREGFDVQSRCTLPDRAQHVRVVLERKFRVKSAHDVQLGRTCGVGFQCFLLDVFE